MFNEELHIAECIENYSANGVEVLIIDNDSTDGTMDIVRRYVGKGVIAVDRLPRDGRFELTKQLSQKEEIARALDADWFIHADADEIRCAPPGYPNLAAAFSAVDSAGFNAVNFMEYVFVPTTHFPNHEHTAFHKTMHWYYPFSKLPNFRLNAWKNQGKSVQVNLTYSAGHQVRFDGMRIFPKNFIMRHYIILSLPHAIRKYSQKSFDEAEVEMGWHGWRAGRQESMFVLPDESDLRRFEGNECLDPSNPQQKHLFINIQDSP